MEALFLKCLNMGIAAGWVILAVLILRLLLKNASKRMRCALWALVGFRLVCPVSFESVLSLVPNAETVPQGIALSGEPAIESGIEALDRAVNPVIAASLVPDVGAGVNPMQIVVFLASVLWTAGLAAMLLYAWVSCLKLESSNQRNSSGEPPSKPLLISCRLSFSFSLVAREASLWRSM